jgi:5-methylcytosine-specific restriction protein B
VKLLEESLSTPNLLFFCRSHFINIDDGTFSDQPNLDWQNEFKNPRQFGDLRVAIVLSKAAVLASSASDLTSKILQTYKQLFPLVLLAISKDSDPILEIEEYLKKNEPLLPVHPKPAIPSNPIPEIEEHPEEDEPPLPIHPVYSLADCAAATYLDEKQLNAWVQAIHRKGQAILYGPPGTGKTFVQFHPAYTYEDFIQGIRPKRVDGGLDYPIVPGRFLEFCKRAQSCGDDACVLIIDEINRANLSQVFGELMYLLEYRDQEVYLASGETFRIPTNVQLIGTMNTADRSIALVDHALRRRFAFLRVEPNYKGLETYHASTNYSAASKLVDLLKTINQQIGDPHYEIGTSFFLRKTLNQEIKSIWQLEIEPYLEEFFFDQPAKMNSLKWETVQKTLTP